MKVKMNTDRKINIKVYINEEEMSDYNVLVNSEVMGTMKFIDIVNGKCKDNEARDAVVNPVLEVLCAHTASEYFNSKTGFENVLRKARYLARERGDYEKLSKINQLSNDISPILSYLFEHESEILSSLEKAQENADNFADVMDKIAKGFTELKIATFFASFAKN